MRDRINRRQQIINNIVEQDLKMTLLSAIKIIIVDAIISSICLILPLFYLFYDSFENVALIVVLSLILALSIVANQKIINRLKYLWLSIISAILLDFIFICVWYAVVINATGGYKG